MSSRFSGFVRRRLCICARLSIWNVPIVSARWMSSYTASSSKGMRERSITSSCVRAICSTQSSTAESIPRPRRSILRKPASEHESLSHWQSWRPAIAAGCTGTSSISGRVETIIPPGCCETWRGRPEISPVSQANARHRFDSSLRSPSGSRATSSPTRFAFQPSESPREPFELREREAERLPHVADRAARAVRREARDERGVLAPVALGDADDELLADVAREVEVDVRAPTRARGSGSGRARARSRPGRRARGP